MKDLFGDSLQTEDLQIDVGDVRQLVLAGGRYFQVSFLRLSFIFTAAFATYPGVSQAQTVVDLTAGYGFTCALWDDGRLKCWGANYYGQLGLLGSDARGDEADEMGANLPYVDLGDGAFVTQVAAGYGHVCALLDTGKVKCWGRNAFGQLGIGMEVDNWGFEENQMGDELPVVDLGGDYKAVKIAIGSRFSCALLDDGSVKCWGSNTGALGTGDSLSVGRLASQMGENLVAAQLGTDLKTTDIAAGGDIMCAIFDDGRMKCLGGNGYGGLGYGDTRSRGQSPNSIGDNLPFVDLGTDATVAQVGVGRLHTCAVTNTPSGRSAMKCWGLNSVGCLGHEDTLNRGSLANTMGENLPETNLFDDSPVQEIFVGSTAYHSCATTPFGTGKCWGYNFWGTLGLGDRNSRGDETGEMGEGLSFVLAEPLTVVAKMAMSESHTCLLTDGGSVRCFGDNRYGQLGYEDTDSRGRETSTIPANLADISL